MKRAIIILILGILVLSVLEAVALNDEKENNILQSIEHTFRFSEPRINDYNQYVKLDIEDRRPSSNMDPYQVTSILFETTVFKTSEKNVNSLKDL